MEGLTKLGLEVMKGLAKDQRSGTALDDEGDRTPHHTSIVTL